MSNSVDKPRILPRDRVLAARLAVRLARWPWSHGSSALLIELDRRDVDVIVAALERLADENAPIP